MSDDPLILHATHTMTVCNACRYCEQYCPVFPAMEQRLTFGAGDLTYLANLCHNCGECLYACQYAPPHAFAIDVPRTMAELRLRSYEESAWPRRFAGAFRRNSVATALGLSAAVVSLLFAVTWLGGGAGRPGPRSDADFYAVMPHGVMVTLFGVTGLLVATALAIGLRRAWRQMSLAAPLPARVGATAALHDVLTLRQLHASGIDCTIGEEVRTPWRRWFHHLTFYGFGLCFASTTVAAIYHTVFGWYAPYAYASAPVVLGTAGGLGLVIGPFGLWALRRRRDPAMSDPRQAGLDTGFIVLLILTSLTGLALMLLRRTAAMPSLLLVHLGIVLALFVTLPYGKFVHGLYRTVALIKYRREIDRQGGRD
jgi:citrate/tricarballylate utilization protein